MKIEIEPTLDYRSFSRENAVESLKRNGLVSVALEKKQGDCAAELIGNLERFNEVVRSRSTAVQVLRQGAKVLWAVLKLVVMHGKLVGLVPFYILDKPHAWNKEANRSGGVSLQFLGRRR